MSIFDLEGSVAIVTGGYGYLGKSMTTALRDAGATVCVFGRSNEKFDREFSADPKNVHFFACDLSSPAEVRESVGAVIRDHEKIDILINNAVYFGGQSPLEISDEDWAFSMDGAIGTVYRCIREVTPHMIAAGGGRILNIASMYGMVSPDFRVYKQGPKSFNPPQYGTAKAAVIQMTRYFAELLGEKGINVNSISPGPFPNKDVQENEGFVSQLAEKTSLRRIGRPEDLAGATVFLASSASNYITGHNLVVDGGWTIS